MVRHVVEELRDEFPTLQEDYRGDLKSGKFIPYADPHGYWGRILSSQ